jgi:hypothetical protein
MVVGRLATTQIGDSQEPQPRMALPSEGYRLWPIRTPVVDKVNMSELIQVQAPPSVDLWHSKKSH